MVVVEIAKSGRSGCRTCNKFIEQDTVRIGTAKNNDGYLNIEWHHSQCFWTKRARQYYYRQKKLINTVLKYEQFSGVQNISEEQREEIKAKILEANLRWATDAALAKVGIVRDAGELESKEAPEPKKAAKGGRKRKADAEPVTEEENNDEAPVAEPPKNKGRHGKQKTEVAETATKKETVTEEEGREEAEEQSGLRRSKRRKT